MTRTGRIFLIICALFLVSADLRVYGAQDISIQATLDREQVGLYQPVQLTITISGNIQNVPDPELPDMPDFEIGGRSSSSSISIINNQVSISKNLIYTLYPKKAGKLKIPPVTLRVGRKFYQSKPLSLEVKKTGTQPPKSSPGPPTTPADKEPQPEVSSGDRNLFITCEVDKKKAYVGEQITLIFKLYNSGRVNIVGNIEYEPPSVTGFWREDLPPQRRYRESIRGQLYQVFEIRTAIFPTAPGKLTIGPAKAKFTVAEPLPLTRRRRSPLFDFDFDFDDFFNDDFFFGNRYKKVPKVLVTNPLQVEILPLPEDGKPDNFSGAVGDFNIHLTTDKLKVKENEAINVTISISGTGNIKTLPEPALPEIKNIKVYESKSREDISKHNYRVQGEKIYEHVIVPYQAGKLTIPPLELSYFDPKKKSYQTVATKPVIIEVEKSDEPGEPIIAAGLGKEEIKLLGSDIRYIKESGALSPASELYFNRFFWFLHLLPPVLIFLLLIFQKHSQRLESDIVYARNLRAYSNSRKKLKRARKLLKSGNREEFYRETTGAILGYLADRLNIASQSIIIDEIKAKCLEKGVEDKTFKLLQDFFDTCNFSRFAASKTTPQDRKEQLQNAKKILKQLDKEMR